MASQEIQRHPLGGQDGAGVALDRRQHRLFRHPIAVGRRQHDMQPGVHQLERQQRAIQPGDHARPARHQPGGGGAVGGDGERAGDVPGAAQILGLGFGSRLAQRAAGRLRPFSAVSVYLLGMVYGLAGFCAGPILGSILTVAALSGHPFTGGALLAVYALGMAVPLFVLAVLWDRFSLGSRRWLRAARRCDPVWICRNDCEHASPCAHWVAISCEPRS